MIRVRRQVTLVREQTQAVGSRARLYGYGLDALASLTGQSVWQVKRHVRKGLVDLGSLSSVVEYLKSVK